MNGNITVAENEKVNGRSAFLAGNAEDYRSRWQSVQGEFVDDPQHAVADADQLVSSAIDKLSQELNLERDKIKGQWPEGSSASTEDLRQALRNYKALLDRLLPV